MICNLEEFKNKHINDKNISVIEVEEIAKGGDYNLSANSYTKDETRDCNWEMVELGDVCEYINGLWEGKKEPFININVIRNTNFTMSGEINYSNIANLNVEEKQFINKKLEFDDIILEKSGGTKNQQVVRVVLFEINDNNYSFSNFTTCLRVKNKNAVHYKYLFNILKNIYNIGITENFQTYTGGIRNLQMKQYLSYIIPLPPLEIQEKIVTEIEEYEKIINGAKEVIDNWKPKIDVREDWEMVKLENKKLFKIETGGTPESENIKYWNDNTNWIILLDLPDCNNINIINNSIRKITDDGLKNSSAKLLPINTIVVSTRGTIGRIGILKEPIATNQGFKNIILLAENFLPKFVALYMLTRKEEMLNKASGGTFKEISKTNFETIKIPLPPLESQQEIVAKIEEEQQYIDGCKKLIEIHKEKIKDVIGKIMGK